MDSRQKLRVQAFVERTISEEDLSLLMQDIESSEAVRHALVEDLRMQGLLRAALTSKADQAALVDAVRRASKAAAGSHLRDGVMSALRDQQPQSSAGSADGKRFPVRFILAAAAALVVGGVIFFGPAESPVEVATVTRAGAGFDVERESGVSSLDSGDTLYSRDVITGTTVAEMLALTYSDGTTLSVVGATKVGLRAVDGAKHLHLQVGKITLDVEPQPTGKPLLVTTPHARAKVIGTVLTVTVTDNRTTLVVDSGVVLFENFVEDKALVEAGHEATIVVGESRIRRQIPTREVDPKVRERYERWKAWGKDLVQDPDTVAYYDFQETAGLGATLTNKAIFFQPDSLHTRNVDGRIRTCSWSEGRFDGLKRSLLFQDLGFVDLSNDHSLRLREPGLTVFVWFKVASFTAPRQPLITLGDYAWRIERYQETDQLTFGCYGLRQNTEVVGKTSVNDERWHLAVGVYDGSALKLYIDGELDATVPANGTIRPLGGRSGTHVLVGANTDVPHADYQGWMDEIGILQRAMTAKDIAELYELGSAE